MSDYLVTITRDDLAALLDYAERVPGRLIRDDEWPRYRDLTTATHAAINQPSQRVRFDPLAKETA